MEEYIKWAKAFIKDEKAQLEADWEDDPANELDERTQDFRAGMKYAMKYLMVRLDRFQREQVVRPM